MTEDIFRDNFERLKTSMNTAKDEYFKPSYDCIAITAEAIRHGNKVMLCGNGGSASTASHITNDFIGHMRNWERVGYPAIALTADISVLTALTNDYGYDQVFSKQFAALGKAGDVLWAFSTSGNSGNIIKAVETAQDKGIKTVVFTDCKGGKLRELCDLWIPVNSDHAMITEALHLFYVHSIAESIEAVLSPV